jgi:SPP1 gp7 family putative phage head morphogenesis protein
MPQGATANIFASNISIATYRRVLAATEVAEEKAKIILAKALADLRGQLAERINAAAARGYDTGPFSTARLQQLISETQKIVGPGSDAAAAKFREFINDNLYDLAIREVDVARLTLAYAIKAGTAHDAITASDGIISEFDPAMVSVVMDKGTLDGVSKTAGLRWAIASPEPHIISSLVQATPIRGHIMTKWIDKWSDSLKSNIAAELTLGFAEGQTAQQIVKRLQRTTDLSQVAARTLIRTSFAAVSANARGILFAENADIVKGVQWVAKLDSHTTPICRELDDQIFPLDKGPRPPAHYNCRSTVAPVLKTFEELFGKTKAALPTTTTPKTQQEGPAFAPIPSNRALTRFKANSLVEVPKETALLTRSNDVAFVETLPSLSLSNELSNADWAATQDVAISAEKIGQLDTLLAGSFAAHDAVIWKKGRLKDFKKDISEDIDVTSAEKGTVDELLHQEFTKFDYFAGQQAQPRPEVIGDADMLLKTTVPEGMRAFADENGTVLLDRGLRFRVDDISEMKVGKQALTVIDVKPVAYDYRRDTLRTPLTELGADVSGWSRLPINRGLVFGEVSVTETPVSSVFAGALVAGAEQIDIPAQDITTQAGYEVKYYEVPLDALDKVVPTDTDLIYHDSISSPAQDALRDYALSGYLRVNTFLRSGGEDEQKAAKAYLKYSQKEASGATLDTKEEQVLDYSTSVLNNTIETANDVAQIDEFMAVARTKVNLTVYRSLPLRDIAGEWLQVGDLTNEDEAKATLGQLLGTEFTDYGFASTSISRAVAHMFTEEKPNRVTMRILVPAGTPAVGITVQDEDEVLLDRGLRYKIVGMSTVDYNDPAAFQKLNAHPGEKAALKRMTLDVEVIGPADNRNAAQHVADGTKFAKSFSPWRNVLKADIIKTVTPISALPKGARETPQPDILPDLGLKEKEPAPPPAAKKPTAPPTAPPTKELTVPPPIVGDVPIPDYKPIAPSALSKAVPTPDMLDLAAWQNKAVLDYTDSGIHYNIPTLLTSAAGKSSDVLEYAAKTVAGIDAVMEKSQLQQDAVLYRGIALPQFLGADEPSDMSELIGKKVSAEYFLSTSADIGIAAEFALDKHGGALLKINVPKGIAAVNAAAWTKAYKDELEVLLDRGLSFRIAKIEKQKVIGQAKPTLLTVITVNVVGYDDKAVKTGNDALVRNGIAKGKLNAKRFLASAPAEKPALAGKEQPKVTPPAAKLAEKILDKPRGYKEIAKEDYSQTTTLPPETLKDSLTPKELAAMRDYVSGLDSGKHNRILGKFVHFGKSSDFNRLNKSGLTNLAEKVAVLDSILRKSQLAEDMILWRGAATEQVFGRELSHKELMTKDFIGQEFTFGGYTSTSISKASAQEFLLSDGVLLKIRAPAKIGAIAASQPLFTKVPGILEEYELILDRGLKFKVVESTIEEMEVTAAWKPTKKKFRVLTVEIVGIDKKRNDVKDALAAKGIKANWSDPIAEALTAVGASNPPSQDLSAELMSLATKESIMNAQHKAARTLTQAEKLELERLRIGKTSESFDYEMKRLNDFLEGKRDTKDQKEMQQAATLVGALDNSMARAPKLASVYVKNALAGGKIGDEISTLGYTMAVDAPCADAVKVLLPEGASIASVGAIMKKFAWAAPLFLLDRGLRFRVVGIEDGVRVVKIVGFDDRRNAWVPLLIKRGIDVSHWLDVDKKIAAVYAAASIVDPVAAKTGLPGSKGLAKLP